MEFAFRVPFFLIPEKNLTPKTCWGWKTWGDTSYPAKIVN